MPKSRDPIERFWEKVLKTDAGHGCWIWTARLNNMGYGLLRCRNPRREEYAHRFSWAIHNGPIPDGLWVLHKCDTPACVNPDHLFLGNREDNSQDMAAKIRGNMAKLTPAQIEEIRAVVRGHQSYGITKTLAERFGVHRSTIRRVAKKITHVIL